jgi:tetratricopeptide (TPR) repeat protein
MAGIGADSLLTSRDNVALRPGLIETDYAQASQLLYRAKALLQDNDADASAAEPLLRECAVLLGGRFLDLPRFENPHAESWLASIRDASAAMEIEVWEILYEAVKNGSLRDARSLRAVREAYLRLYGTEDEIRTNKPCLTWNGVVGHISLLEREGVESLTVTEERLLCDAIEERLSSLPLGTRSALASLAVFPSSFTALQAKVVCSISAAVLTRLHRCGLLRLSLSNHDNHESPPGASRYAFLPFVQQVALGWLPEVELASLRRHHLAYFATLADTNSRVLDNFSCEHLNWIQAVEEALSAPLTRATYKLLEVVLNHLHVRDAILHQQLRERALVRLNETIWDLKEHPSAVLAAQQLLASHYFDAGDYRTCLNVLRNALEHFLHNDLASFAEGKAMSAPPSPNLGQVCLTLLMTAHHAGYDREFDEACTFAASLMDHWVRNDKADAHDRELFRLELLYLQAERQYSRGHFNDALEVNARAEATYRQLGDELPVVAAQRAALAYQRGCLLKATGRREEAMLAFDEALPIFAGAGELHRHGVADCYQKMGAIMGEMGLIGLAEDRIWQAVRIYETLGKPASRAAALGTLGDLQAQTGETNIARNLYTEGLSFWQTQGHHGWVRRFEERLERLHLGQKQ